MPLPEDKAPWPPLGHKKIFERLERSSAWYTGDPEELSRIYGGSSVPVVNRPSQFRGGLVGAVSRMFWGQPIPINEPRTKLHIPLAGDIATTSTDLLFSEAPALAADDTATQDWLTEVIDDGLHTTLLEAGDVASGLGGVFLRLVWDRELSPRPWLDAVHADSAIAEFRWGRLVAVTFWTVIHADDDVYVRHLERREPGVILHGVYVGDRDSLGKRVDPSAFPETAQYSGDNAVVATVPGLSAWYVPNMRPARQWRNLPAATGLGAADCAGVEPELDALDETWSSWMRDIRLGKGRVFVPESMLESSGPGRGAAWDPDREIYSTLAMLPSKDRSQLTLNQFDIRVDEHERTADRLTQQIVRSAGYSAQSFGLTGDVAVTATEVNARERKSFVTRNKKIRYWLPALRGGTEMLLVMAKAMGEKVTPQTPQVIFADSVSEAPEVTARTVQLLDAARSASIETRVRMVNPEWEDDEVTAEVKRIKDENNIGKPVPDPGTFTGGPALPFTQTEDDEDEQADDEVEDDAPVEE